MPDTLTIMQLVPELQGGGVERGTVEVNAALVAAGNRSLVVSAGGRLVDQVIADGGEHIEMPIGRKSLMTLGCIPRLRRLAKQQKADVLHARSRVPAWVACLAWHRMDPATRPAFVTTVHGLNSVSFYSKIMTKGQRVEVVSNTVRDYVLKHYPDTNPDKLELIYRGVDPAQFPFGYTPEPAWLDSWREQYPQLQARFIITLAGRLTRLKGHHDLINAVDTLQQQGINAHGLIVGGEDPRRKQYAQELRETVARRNLEPHITFTGHRSDIRNILAISGAVVSLSTKPESFGRSVLEAVRLGRPVVGYNHGGVGEVLSAVYPPGLTPLGDPQALVDALARIARGQAPPPEPTDRFLLSEMLDKTLAMYEAVAASRFHEN
ncbi:MAG: glycosyltransferase family 4 protein [Planctomycetota bacterium]